MKIRLLLSFLTLLFVGQLNAQDNEKSEDNKTEESSEEKKKDSKEKKYEDIVTDDAITETVTHSSISSIPASSSILKEMSCSVGTIDGTMSPTSPPTTTSVYLLTVESPSATSRRT